METTLINLKTQIIILTPKVISGILVFVLFWVVGLIIKKVVTHISKRTNVAKNIILLLGRTINITFVILGIVSGLGTMGVNISALVASLGLTGFALGFALRDALSNLLAGVLILIYQPFEIGDTISVTGFQGKIVKIDLRYTVLESDDKNILIPNSNLFNNPFTVNKKK